jgi:signal peptidase II
VRDFIKWYVGSYVWPTFNIADAALVVGIGIIIIAEFKAGRDAQANAPAAAAAQS